MEAFIRQLPSLQDEFWVETRNCEGMFCAARISQVVTDETHRAAICEAVAALVEAQPQRPVAGEPEFARLIVLEAWAAEFCDPALASRAVALAEMQSPEFDFSGLASQSVAYLAAIPYLIGKPETGERIARHLLSLDNQFGEAADFQESAEITLFLAEVLTGMGHFEASDEVLKPAWEPVARQAPTAAGEYLPLWYLVEAAELAATNHWLREHAAHE